MESSSRAINEDHSNEPNFLAGAIFTSYSQRLLQLASEQLAKNIRSKVSPEDIVQSALKSFFRNSMVLHAESADPDRIWELLSVITIRKCRKWEAFFYCSKRDVRREVRNLSDEESDARMSKPEVVPDQADCLVAAELVEQLLGNFSDRQQEMLLLSIQGLPVEKIAKQCNSSLRTVARTIAKAKSLLEKSLEKCE